MRARACLILAAALMPAALLSLAGGCGSNVQVGRAGDSGGNGGEGGFIFINGGGGTTPDAGKDGDLPDAIDPGCPDKPPPIEDFLCDPYEQFNGDCGPGEACYIFVDYPNEPCGQEVYGAYCFPEGGGGQGAPCNGGLDCQAGHVCVITGSGTQCVQLCNLFGNDGCPPGLLCEAIDVEGFGGCL